MLLLIVFSCSSFFLTLFNFRGTYCGIQGIDVFQSGFSKEHLLIHSWLATNAPKKRDHKLMQAYLNLLRTYRLGVKNLLFIYIFRLLDAVCSTIAVAFTGGWFCCWCHRPRTERKSDQMQDRCSPAPWIRRVLRSTLRRLKTRTAWSHWSMRRNSWSDRNRKLSSPSNCWCFCLEGSTKNKKELEIATSL